MMREIALTPQSLDPSEHADQEEWAGWATELLHRMFPDEGVARFLIADLYGGSWSHQLPEVETMKELPQRQRWRIQSLMRAMKEHAVTRPARLPEWPQREDDWVAEALESAKQLTIARIVSTPAASTPSDAVAGLIRTDNRYREAGFWDDVCCTGRVALRLSDQLELLRPIAMHSTWIALANPHALGSESEFTLKFARTAAKRPDGFQPLQAFDLHVHAKDGTPASESAKDYWSRQLTQPAGLAGKVRVFFWAEGKLLDRILLAGDIEPGRLPSQRWGIHLGHVARNDDADGADTEWKLLSRVSRFEWRKRLYEMPGSAPLERWEL